MAALGSEPRNIFNKQNICTNSTRPVCKGLVQPGVGLLSLFVFWNYRYIFQSSSYKMLLFIYVLPSFTLSTVMFQVKLSTALLSLRPFSPSFSPSRERSSWKSIPVKHESRSIIEAEQLGNRQIKFRWNIAVKRMDDFPQLSQLQLRVCCRINQTDMFT